MMKFLFIKASGMIDKILPSLLIEENHALAGAQTLNHQLILSIRIVIDRPTPALFCPLYLETVKQLSPRTGLYLPIYLGFYL
jgi:hypothetical protein